MAHDHLDIFCMPQGGYVVGPGQWDDGRRDGYNWKGQHLAAFTTLGEAMAFIAVQMTNRPSAAVIQNNSNSEGI
jgi:hypothetical protein